MSVPRPVLLQLGLILVLELQETATVRNVNQRVQGDEANENMRI